MILRWVAAPTSATPLDQKVVEMLSAPGILFTGILPALRPASFRTAMYDRGHINGEVGGMKWAASAQEWLEDEFLNDRESIKAIIEW